MFKLLRLAAMAAAFSFTVSSGAGAQQGWELLGTTLSEPRIEQSIIQVGKREGRYQAVQIGVSRNDAEILDLRVVYGNGQTENIAVREIFRAGTKSRRIAVKGGDRFIKEIVVTYRALGPVQIQAFGEPSLVVRWVELGCRSVGFGVDRDIIKLSPRDGRFDSIKLRVIGNKIEVFDLRVVYGNGSPDNIPVRAIIADRGETRALPLRGISRALDRVELIYRSQPSFKGKAVLCVDGRSVSGG